jgi:hypothetical protein
VRLLASEVRREDLVEQLAIVKVFAIGGGYGGDGLRGLIVYLAHTISRGNPRSFGSVDGGAISVISFVKASSRSICCG